MTQAPCAREGGDSSPPPKSLLPGEKAPGVIAGTPNTGDWRRSGKAPNGGAVRPQELLNHPG
jgi:hypothetical protein